MFDSAVSADPLAWPMIRSVTSIMLQSPAMEGRQGVGAPGGQAPNLCGGCDAPEVYPSFRKILDKGRKGNRPRCMLALEGRKEPSRVRTRQGWQAPKCPSRCVGVGNRRAPD